MTQPLPVIEPTTLTRDQIATLQHEIRELASRRHAGAAGEI